MTTYPSLALRPQGPLPELRPYQREAIDQIYAARDRGVTRQLGVAATGTGKGLRVGTPVLTPAGWVPVEMLEEGGFVVGADGKPIQINGVFHRGVQPAFRVTTDDGVELVVDAEHLWTVATDSDMSRGRSWRTVNTATLAAGSLGTPGRRKWRLPIVAPIETPEASLPIDPYVIGVLIADGSLTQIGINFCPGDDQIAAEVKNRLPKGLELRVHPSATRATSYAICDPLNRGTGKHNRMGVVLDTLGLRGHGALTKRIPPQYLAASINQRWTLLRGLMDCDGWGGGGAQYATSSPKLAEDVVALVRSLGGVARVSSKIPSYLYKGERRQGALAYTVSLRLNGCPFLLPRKAAEYNARPRLGPTRKLAAIEPTTPTETVCIKVGAADGLFVTAGYVVTHNTVIFANLAREVDVPTLIVAHRDELIEQAVDKLRVWWPGVDVGVVKAARQEWRAQVVVASVQSLHERRLRGVPTDRFGLVIVDECFPAGTMVGSRTIESLRPGDVVPSFDEAAGTLVQRTVVRTMAKPPSALVRLTLSDGSILTCTPEHPLYTPDGWMPASKCTVVAIASRRDQDMRSMRPSDAFGQPPDVLNHMPVRAGRPISGGPTEEEDGVGSRRDVLLVCGVPADHAGTAASAPALAQGGPGVLLPRLPVEVGEQELVRDNGRHEPAVRVRPDEGAEPDVRLGRPRADGSVAATQGLARWRGAWRQRTASLRTRAAHVVRPGLANDRDRSDEDAPLSRLPDALQAGRRQRGPQGGDRMRRALSLFAGAPSAGPAEGGVPGWTRVDRVEVLEPGRDRTFGGVCPGGLVYNLEVQGTHTYVADGVVVHNCHHAKADSYVRILNHFGCGPDVRSEDGPLLLGVTATPDRGDGKGLDALFDEIVFNYDILWGIRAGYLSDVRGVQVLMKNLDLSDVKVTRGDYNEGQLGEAMEKADAPEHVVAAWLQHASTRRTLVFMPTVALAVETAEEFQASGVSAGWVSGALPIEQRRDVFRRFSTGDMQVLVNCMVASEGYDNPAIDCVVMARPTKSRALYCQAVGRGTRKFPGKADALILDVVGAASEHDLATIPSLFGIEAKEGFFGGEKTVLEALDEQEERQRLAGALIAREVELFHRLREKNRVAWVKAGSGNFAASAGDETIVLVPGSTGDLWTVRALGRNIAPRTLMADVDLELAQGVGDDYVRRSKPAILADPNAGWRKRKPSDRALMAAAKWGVKVPPKATAGQVSELIDAAVAKRRLQDYERQMTKATAPTVVEPF